MTIAQLKELCLHAAKGTVPANFSEGSVDINAAVVDGLKELAPTVNAFMKNKYDIFEIITETVDEVVPQNVMNAVAPFAEVVTVAQGQKARFKIKNKLGRERAKRFLTQVGLAGVYETFRLDTDSFEVGAHAVGGAISIDWERLLDGADTIPELMDIVAEGMENALYVEIHRALVSAIDTLSSTTKNKAIVNGWDPDKMATLVNTVKTYGRGAAIFATPTFITEMGADPIAAKVITVANGNGVVYHPDDIDAIHNLGRVRIFRGTPIVEIPQSYTDDQHNTTYIDDSIAYILPTNGEKIVKVVLEGDTQMWDYMNADHSIELNVYKKIGAAVMARNDWAIYRNAALVTDTLTEDPANGFGLPDVDTTGGYGF